MSKIKIIDEEHKYELITRWLSCRGRSSGDVLTDEKGDYIISDPSEGEVEDEGMTMFSEGDKLYLPEELQRNNVQF